MQRLQIRSRAFIAPVMALGLMFFVTSTARAASQVDIKYNLSDSSGTSTVTLPAVGVVEFPLGSENFSGSQTIRYTSDSASNPVDGPVSLRSFQLSVIAPIYTSPPDPVTNPDPRKISTSTLRLSIPGLPAGGGSLAGSVISPQGIVATFYGTGTVTCLYACFAANLTPYKQTLIQPFSFAQPLPALQTSGNGATVSGTSTSTFLLDPGQTSTPFTADNPEIIPVTAVTTLIGREVSRQTVPEPGAVLRIAAALGTVALAGIGRRFLRRR